MRIAQNILKAKRLRWGLGLMLLTLGLSSLPLRSQEASAATTPPKTGVVCTSNATSTFTLTAQDGSVGTPDGNIIYMWSYSEGSNAFQLPGPVLCVKQGDNVTITLNNMLPEDVSMIFPGIENVKVNGQAAQPQFDGAGNLTSLTNVATKKTGSRGGSVTYKFTATEPGTFLYESGTDPAKQVNMGLFGAIVVRPTLGANFAYNRADSIFNPAAEYVMIMSEVDPDLHQAVERGQNYDITKNHPRYWMINGRSFPDTIADNNAAWLPGQPYGSLVHMQTYNSSPTAPSNKPALVRYLNAGMLNHPFHPHGNHGRVIGRDGRALQGPVAEDLSYEKFLVLLGAGQTWDVTYQWTDVELWQPGSNPIPAASFPQQQNLTYKDAATWYSGSPYLGVQDGLPVGVTSYNQCGEYYHVWHSHALNEAANYDTGFGGMFTLQRVDPPSPNHCPA